MQRDIAEAVRYAKLSANADPPCAFGCNQLAKLYGTGDGVAQSMRKSFQYFLKSAELHDVDGQLNVAICYRMGQGTDRNILRAAYW